MKLFIQSLTFRAQSSLQGVQRERANVEVLFKSCTKLFNDLYNVKLLFFFFFFFFF